MPTGILKLYIHVRRVMYEEKFKDGPWCAHTLFIYVKYLIWVPP